MQIEGRGLESTNTLELYLHIWGNKYITLDTLDIEAS